MEVNREKWQKQTELEAEKKEINMCEWANVARWVIAIPLNF